MKIIIEVKAGKEGLDPVPEDFDDQLDALERASRGQQLNWFDQAMVADIASIIRGIQQQVRIQRSFPCGELGRMFSAWLYQHYPGTRLEAVPAEQLAEYLSETGESCPVGNMRVGDVFDLSGRQRHGKG
jgi:hypothetical protein